MQNQSNAWIAAHRYRRLARTVLIDLVANVIAAFTSVKPTFREVFDAIIDFNLCSGNMYLGLSSKVIGASKSSQARWNQVLMPDVNSNDITTQR